MARGWNINARVSFFCLVLLVGLSGSVRGRAGPAWGLSSGWGRGRPRPGSWFRSVRRLQWRRAGGRGVRVGVHVRAVGSWDHQVSGWLFVNCIVDASIFVFSVFFV